MFKYFIVYLSYYGPSNQNDWALVDQQIRAECKRQGYSFDYFSSDVFEKAIESFVLFCDYLGIPVDLSNGMMTIENQSTLDGIIDKYEHVTGKMKKLIDQFRFVYSYYGKHKVTEGDEMYITDFKDWLEDIKHQFNNAGKYEIAGVMFYKGNDA